ncbi:hypothetical protein CROQUDRAFT_43678 [Cronartium quercuum f. sp. fusiforme G11]|uniref:Acyltransferase 3 domain-containing protein n=1 Tax=Cronartium quercuum f. sp. fusiforme G11 TaxID=708437 RepID=A0A9P6TCM0_9BASI|nr:hypothetical protein CROQUDRAFT_43678 [Cronartium quercuum f. sp. fusiforme G11]
MWETMGWTNGLKGLITLLIVFHHASLAFHPSEATLDCFGRGIHGIWHTSIIEALVGSQFLVFLYFTLSGYVISLRHFSSLYLRDKGSLGLVHQIGQICLHRLLTLVATVIISTCGSLYLWFLGAYALINNGEFGSQWAKDVSLKQDRANWREVVVDNFKIFFYVWFDPSQASKYNHAQWTLCSELFGMIGVFLFAISTLSLKSLSRKIVGIILIASMYLSRWIGPASFLLGGLMADIHMEKLFSDPSNQHMSPVIPRAYCNLGAISLILWACIITSFPTYQSFNQIPHQIYLIVQTWFEGNPVKIGQFFSSIGAAITLPAVLISSDCKEFLSHEVLCSLGDISLSLYFTHLPILFLIGSVTLKVGIKFEIPATILWYIIQPFWISAALAMAWTISELSDDLINWKTNFRLVKSIYNYFSYHDPPTYQESYQVLGDSNTLSIIIVENNDFKEYLR